MSRLPSLKPRDVIRALERAGFILSSVRGSHHVFRHPDRRRPVVVAYHARELKRGALAGIIKQAGLTQQEFRELL